MVGYGSLTVINLSGGSVALYMTAEMSIASVMTLCNTQEPLEITVNEIPQELHVGDTVVIYVNDTTHLVASAIIAMCSAINTATSKVTVINPRCVQMKGDKGDKGDTGKGIASVTEYYALNDDASTAPNDNSFDQTVKTPTSSNKYVWNYEQINYTDNSTPIKTTKHIAAVYGSTGKGISTVTEYYVKSSSTTAPADSSFSETVPVLDATNKYLWNYEVISYTDNTTSSTAKRIIGVYGETGIGVSSIVDQYYLSTSNTTRSGGSWGTTIPSYVSGRYYWRRQSITWTDGTTTNTTAVLDNALTDANSTAYSKNKTFHQASEPTAQDQGPFVVGDTWFNTSLGNSMYKWNGSSWTLEEFDSPAIKAGAITVSHLTVGDMSNLATVNENDVGSMVSSPSSIATDIVTVSGSKRVAKKVDTQTGLALSQYKMPNIFVDGDEVYYSIRIRAVSTARNIVLRISAYDASGTKIGDNTKSIAITTTMTRYTGTITIADVTTGDNQFSWSSATSYAIYISDGKITGDTYENLRMMQAVVRKKGTGDMIVNGTIKTDNLDAGAVTTDKLFTGAVTADKIEAGAITAEKIAANSISASKLAIGMNNLATVNEWDDNSMATTPTGYESATAVINSETGLKGIVKANVANTHLALSQYQVPNIFANGDEIYYSFRVRTMDVDRTIVLQIAAYDKNGTRLGANTKSIAATNTMTAYSGTITLSGNTTGEDQWAWSSSGTLPVAAYYFIYILDSSGANHQLRMMRVEIRKKSSGQLIVDGTITADKLTADAINGKTITGTTLRTPIGRGYSMSYVTNKAWGDTYSDEGTPVRNDTADAYLQMMQSGFETIDEYDTIRSRMVPVLIKIYTRTSSSANPSLTTKNGWYLSNALYSPRIFTESGEVATMAINDSSCKANDAAVRYFTPTSGNSWSTLGDCWYYKIGTRVHIHVSVSGLTADTNTSVFTMPAGYRPFDYIIAAGRGNNGSTYCSGWITSAGVISVRSTNTGAALDLEYDAFN